MGDDYGQIALYISAYFQDAGSPPILRPLS